MHILSIHDMHLCFIKQEAARSRSKCILSFFKQNMNRGIIQNLLTSNLMFKNLETEF